MHTTLGTKNNLEKKIIWELKTLKNLRLNKCLQRHNLIPWRHKAAESINVRLSVRNEVYIGWQWVQISTAKYACNHGKRYVLVHFTLQVFLEPDPKASLPLVTRSDLSAVCLLRQGPDFLVSLSPWWCTWQTQVHANHCLSEQTVWRCS